ncbi:iron complex outermembrane receptor protein [Novosphingobium sp. SG751A]|uniref:TonB-dependent receptor n=1 Tax=Novosphingobium sp. SG751A TaxID=2587000 RepID=UPI00155664FA|nr:TonB-dependent receptor [Novosphingobium sp. SG751A]NOW45323.1 iron complex outermembrane receptor protein [Novosphingobium sp. SG751A]
MPGNRHSTPPRARILACSSLVMLAAAGWSAPALAEQDASAAPVSPGEIVVTAQFRSQRLQDTPLAITAMDSSDIQQRNLGSVLDVAGFAPNVNIRPGGSAFGPAAQVYIRGIGQYDSSFAFEPGVGMYVDDVFHGTMLGSIFDLLDLDRVEILRGPQGTLAGKNSIGGAVKLYSAKPTGSGHGYIEAGYGAFNRIELKGSADFALVPDQLFLRVSGVSKMNDGYLTRLDYGCLNPSSGVPAATTNAGCKLGTEGGKNMQAGRVALRWLASDRLEANLVAMATEDHSEIGASKLLSLTTSLSMPTGTNPAQFITAPNSYTNYATYLNLPFTDAKGSHGASYIDPVSKVSGREIYGTIDYKLGDGLSLKLISAYQRYKGSYGSDLDLTPYSTNSANYIYNHEQFTQEIRLNGSSLDNRLDWTVGGFYYKATSRFGGVTFIAPGTAAQNFYVTQDRIPARSISGFAHASYKLTDALTLTGGIRYTDDRKTYTYGRLNPYDVSQPAYTVAGAINGVTGQFAATRWDYRANAEYRWSKAVMTYAQFSTGYKGGGVNPRPFAPEQAVSFKPETLDAWEIGAKTDLFDRALRINLSAFFNKYHDIVFTNVSPTANSVTNATPVNAGDADMKGVEVEVTARPIAGLTIDASASWLDFKLTRIGAAGATIVGITTNNRAPYAPEWKLGGGIQYAFALGKAGTVTPRFDVNYQSAFFSNIDNNPLAKVDGYVLANARIAFEDANRDWQLAFTLTNMFDKFYYLNKIRYPIGIVVGQPAMPREWKISLRRSF